MIEYLGYGYLTVCVILGLLCSYAMYIERKHGVANRSILIDLIAIAMCFCPVVNLAVVYILVHGHVKHILRSRKRRRLGL